MIVNFAWIFFRIENLGDVMSVLKKIFTDIGTPFIDPNTILLAFLAATIVFIYDFVTEYQVKLHFLSSKHITVRYMAAALIICYIIGFGVLNGGSFIYFQF